jgi:hypothetical protein
MTRVVEKSRQQGATATRQVRELVENFRELRETVELAIAEMEKGRIQVAANILRGTRRISRRKRK